MEKGKIIILSGPSGSGKTTLHQKLLQSPAFKGKLVKSLSATTRLPRVGEKNGRDYLFLSKEDFLDKQKRGEFLEFMQVFENYYGTPKDKVDAALKKGKSVLLCIDVKGAKVVSSKYPDAVKVFVKTPTLADLKKRLSKRGTESSKDLELRFKFAKAELKEAKHYHHVVVNGSLAHAYRDLARILNKEIFKKAVLAKSAAKKST
ncbi:MAG: guanylate kinase [Candidatus Omnitrophica bacterium]|nr:guanylate kinase [Candidatus Omnitrophota bacterium]